MPNYIMNELIEKINKAFDGLSVPRHGEVSVKEDWDSDFIEKYFGMKNRGQRAIVSNIRRN